MGHIQIKPTPGDSSLKAHTGNLNTGPVTYNGTEYELYRLKLKNGCVLILPDGSSSAWMRSDCYNSLSGMEMQQIFGLPIEFGDFMIVSFNLYRAKGSDATIEIRE